MASKLTHLSGRGEARMVDISHKVSSKRVAIAEGRVRMKPKTLALVRKGNAKKGDVLAAARLSFRARALDPPPRSQRSCSPSLRSRPAPLRQASMRGP